MSSDFSVPGKTGAKAQSKSRGESKFSERLGYYSAKPADGANRLSFVNNGEVDHDFLNKAVAAISRIQSKITPIKAGRPSVDHFQSSSADQSSKPTTEIRALKAPTKDDRKTMFNMGKEIKKLRTSLAQANANIKILKTKSNFDKRLLEQDYQVSTDKTRSRISSLQNSVAQHEEMVKSERESSKMLRIEYTNLERKYKELQRRHDDEVWDLKLSLTNAREQGQSMSGDVNRHQVVLDKYQQRLAEQKEQFEKMATEKTNQQTAHFAAVKKLKEQISSLTKESQSRKDDYDHLLQSTAAKIDALTDELAKKSSKIVELANHLSKFVQKSNLPTLQDVEIALSTSAIQTKQSSNNSLDQQTIQKDLLRVSMLEVEKELSTLDLAAKDKESTARIQRLEIEVTRKDKTVQALKEKLQVFYTKMSSELDAANSRIDHLQQSNVEMEAALKQEKKKGLKASIMSQKAIKFVQYLKEAKEEDAGGSNPENSKTPNVEENFKIAEAGQKEEGSLGSLVIDHNNHERNRQISKDALEIFAQYESLVNSKENIMEQTRLAEDEAAHLRQSVHDLEELYEQSSNPNLRENGRYLRELIHERDEKEKAKRLTSELGSKLDVEMAKNMALTATASELKDVLHRKTVTTSSQISDLEDSNENLQTSVNNLKSQLNGAYKTISDLQGEATVTRTKLDYKLKEINRLRSEVLSKSRLVADTQDKINLVAEERDFVNNEKQDKMTVLSKELEEAMFKRRAAENTLGELRISMSNMENTMQLSQMKRRKEREAADEEKRDELRVHAQKYAANLHALEEQHRFELKRLTDEMDIKTQHMRDEKYQTITEQTKLHAKQLHDIEVSNKAKVEEIIAEYEKQLKLRLHEMEEMERDSARRLAGKLHEVEEASRVEHMNNLRESTDKIEELTFKLNQSEAIKEENMNRVENLVSRLKAEQSERKDLLETRRHDIDLCNDLSEKVKVQGAQIKKMEAAAKHYVTEVNQLRTTNRHGRHQFLEKLEEQENKIRKQSETIAKHENETKEKSILLSIAENRVVESKKLVAQVEKEVQSLKLQITGKHAAHSATLHIVEDLKFELEDTKAVSKNLKDQLKSVEFNARKAKAKLENENVNLDISVESLTKKLQKTENDLKSREVKLVHLSNIVKERDMRIKALGDSLTLANKAATKQREEDLHGLALEREKAKETEVMLRKMEISAKETEIRLYSLKTSYEKKLVSQSKTLEQQKVKLDAQTVQVLEANDRAKLHSRAQMDGEKHLMSARMLLKEKQKELLSVESELTKLQSRLFQSKHTIKNMELKCVSLTTDKTNLGVEVERYKESMRSMEEAHANESKIYLHKMSVEQKLSNDLSSQNHTLSAKVAAMSSKIEQLHSKIFEKEERLQEALARIDDTKLHKMTEKNGYLERDLQILRHKLGETQEDKRRAQQLSKEQFSQLEEANKRLEIQLNSMEATHRDKVQQAEKARKKIYDNWMEEIQRRQMFAGKTTGAQQESARLQSELEQLRMSMKRANATTQNEKTVLEENLLHMSSKYDAVNNKNEEMGFSLAMCVEDRLSLELKHRFDMGLLKDQIEKLEKENIELHLHEEKMALERMRNAKDIGLKGHGENRHLNLEEQRHLVAAVQEGVEMVRLKDNELDHLRIQLAKAEDSHKSIQLVKKSEYERTIQKLIESHAKHEKEIKDKHTMMQSRMMRQMKSNFLKLSKASKQVQHEARVSVTVPRWQYQTCRMIGEDFRSMYLREQEKRINLQTLVKSIHQEAAGIKLMKETNRTTTEKINVQRQYDEKEQNEWEKQKRLEQSILDLHGEEQDKRMKAETFQQLEQLKKDKNRLVQENKDNSIRLKKYKNILANQESKQKVLREENIRLGKLIHQAEDAASK